MAVVHAHHDPKTLNPGELVFRELLAEESADADRRSWLYRCVAMVSMGLLLILAMWLGRLGHTAVWDLCLFFLAGGYHIVIYRKFSRNAMPLWARYLMAALDITILSLWFYVASAPYGVQYLTSSAALFTLPLILFAVATRLDRGLILFATAWAVVSLNLVYIFLLPEGLASPVLQDFIAGWKGQLFRTLCLVGLGMMLLLFPHHVFRLLRREVQLFEQKTRVDQDYRDLVEQAQSIIMKLDGQGRITFFNSYAGRFFGYDEGEALGRSPWSLLAPGRQAAEERERLMSEALAAGRNSNRGWCEEALLRRKDGSLVWVAWSHRMVCDDGGATVEVVCVGNDITARHQAEEALRRAHDDLERQVAERTSELEDANSELTAEVARRAQVEAELRGALSDVKQLSGLLPICSRCKKIRDDQGYWNHVEEYIREHSQARFSHSLCPVCMRQLYPDIADDILSKLEKDDY